MKKLLTILLTIVVSIGLVVLNNNYINAEDTSSNVDVGGRLEIRSSDGHLQLVTSGSTTDLDDGNHTTDKENLGIVTDVTKHILKLSLDLSNDVTSSIINNHVDREKIELLNDINLTKNVTSASEPIVQNSTDCNLIIDGGAGIKTLALKTATGVSCQTGISVSTGGTLTLKNMNLAIDGDFSTQCISTENLTIDNHSMVVLINNSNTGNALKVTGTLTIPSNYEVLGSTVAHPEQNQMKVATKNTSTNIYEVDDGTGAKVPAKCIAIKPKESVKPEPQPKDESCEKVIGPSWHWNNEKGVCEEYATVGTSTR